MNKRILIAAQDPGGTLSLLPVIKRIKSDKRFDFEVFAGKYSYDLFKKQGIRFVKAGELSQKELTERFKRFAPGLVLTSTSFGFSVEKRILRIAKKLDIKTISIIDFWSNYWLRFIRKGERRDPKYLPDKIIAIDDIMKKEMEGLRFPSDRIEVLGNPHFESFKFKRIPKNKNTFQILFVSQPLREIYKNIRKLEYDEFSVLKDILEVIRNDGRICLIVRLHPKDNRSKYKSAIGSESRPQIRIDEQGDLDSLISGSDLILGMSSMVLFRASFFENPVISYQPGLKDSQKDSLISNRLKLSELCVDKECLERKILMVLNGKRELKKQSLRRKLIKKYIDSRPTEKIINLIHEQYS